jgi:acetyltransferase-like isoleucine patch superfamily enzyme
MNFYEALAADLERLAGESLNRPGLRPAWSPNVSRETYQGAIVASIAERELATEIDDQVMNLVEDPESLKDLPPRDWPSDLLILFRLGFLFLRDDATEIAPTVQFDGAFRVILRNVRLSHFVVLSGGPILVADSTIGTHGVLVGPTVIQDSRLDSHAFVGHGAHIAGCFFASHTKAQMGVRARLSLFGAFAGLDGGTHPEQYPLTVNGEVPAGIEVGAHGWIGHHASLLAGARTGEGVVVGAGVVLTKELGDHLMLVGSPPRPLPIDFHIRASSPEEAFAAGQRQGAMAALLPVYGRTSTSFVLPQLLRIRYPEHGVTRGLAGPRLLDFHRGALAALMKMLVLDEGIAVRSLGGDTVQFEVAFSRPVRPFRRLGPDADLTIRSGTGLRNMPPDEGSICEFLSRGSFTYEELMLAVGEPDTGLEPMTMKGLSDCVHSLSERGVFAHRFVRWPIRTNRREAEVLRAFADISGRGDVKAEAGPGIA